MQRRCELLEAVRSQDKEVEPAGRVPGGEVWVVPPEEEEMLAGQAEAVPGEEGALGSGSRLVLGRGLAFARRIW